MIREFEDYDIDHFTPNEFSDTGGRKNFVKDRRFHKYTLEIEGIPECLIFFRHIMQGEWATFLLLGKDFKPSYMRHLKKFLHETVERLQIRKVQTFSLDDERLNGLHEFFGFELALPKFTKLDNKEFNYWERCA